MIAALRYTLVAMLLCMVMPQLLVAAPTFSSSATWASAQAGRTWMDIGGVWNGTTEVTATTGDPVSFALGNTGTIAYELAASVNLATGFNYVAGTASVAASGAGCGTAPTATASQTGSTLTFALLPAGYDLPATCTLTFQYGLTTSPTVIAGTFQMDHRWDYSATQGGALTGTPGSRLLNILVFAGASIIAKIPGNQLKAVNNPAAWTVSVTNTGLGGLFDVYIDESTINPSAALALTTMTVNAPAAPAATSPTTSKRQLVYLAPGVSFDAYVEATVKACRDINNDAYTSDRSGATADVGTAQVTLDMLLPLVALTIPNTNVPYTGTTSVTITIDNTGLGAAANFTLQSQLNTIGVTVSNVAAGWTYASGTGLFTYTAGTIANAATVNLTFDIAAGNVCTFAGGSNLHWTAIYTDVCGNAYAVPIVLSSVGAATGAPSISLTKTSADSRLVVDTYSSFSLGFSATNTGLISGTSFSVTDTLPAGISNITITPPAGTSYSCPGGTCDPSEILTWTVPKAALPLLTTMLIDYKAPADNCVGGSVLTNSASVAATSTASCVLSASASAGPLMTNNPGATVTQRFDVDIPISGAAFETGNADNGNITRDATEGEFIPFTATYIYDNLYPGTWSGSTYLDDFGGLTSGGATLVSGSLAVKVDNGGALIVPNASVTCTTGTIGANTCAGSFTIDLTFLAGAAYFNDPYVAAHQLNIDYSLTASDANLGASTTASYTQLVTLAINGGGAGGCNTGLTPTYTQGAFVAIARAAATVAVTVPTVIDVCQNLSVTMTASNGTEEFPNNVFSTLLTTGNYAYPTGQTPTYGGLFTGNITYLENAGTNPTFELTPTTRLLSANGTASFLTRLKAGSSLTPTPLQVTLDYDDYQTAGGARDFTATGQSTPALIQAAQLAITITPQLYTVIDGYAEWKIYVTNLSSGTAYATELINQLPTGVTLDSAATDLANNTQSCAPLPNCNVAFSDPYVTWQLGDIPPATTRTMTLKAALSGATCSIPDGSNKVTTRWGCGGAFHEVVAKNEPNFLFPAGQMQVVHDTTATSAPLCGTGKDVIIVRNTGKPHVLNVVASEAMNPAASGLDIVLGTVEYSTDSGATWTATGDPTGLGTTASPYQWDKTIIAALGDLSPVSEVGVSEVRIRFDIKAGELANSPPTIQASAVGNISCGNTVSSPGTPYSIPVSTPNITVSKTGINRTAAGGAIGSGTYVNQVFGGVGDLVEWKVSVSNNGSMDAYNVRLTDVFAGSNPTLIQMVQAPVGYATPSAFVDGTTYTAPNVPATTTQGYYIQETLGNSCVGAGSLNTADVTWGCVDKGANTRSTLSTPTTNSDTASLVMLPGFTAFAALSNTQTITYLPAGRAKVDVDFTNTGGTAQNLVLKSTTFPANMRIDPYASPKASVLGTATCATPTTAPCLDGTVTVTGTDTAPIFTLNGTGMRNSTTATLTFYLLPTVFDDQYASTYSDLIYRETGALDLALSIGGDHIISLDAPSTCANPNVNANTVTVTPLIPDLDFIDNNTIGLNPHRQLGAAGYTRNYDFHIRNKEGATGSTADNFTVSFPQIGNGLTILSVKVTTAGTTGTTGDCAPALGIWTCTSAQLGYYKNGTTSGNINVRVRATILDNGSPLTILGQIKGEVVAQDGTTVVGNYSLDHGRPRILGVGVDKTLLSTSEAFTTVSDDVAIGEELNYRLNVRLFGGDLNVAGSGDITNILFRDLLPAGMGLVSLTASPYNAVTVTGVAGSAMPAGATPLNTGNVEFSVADINTGEGTFEYYMTTRVLNIPANVDADASNQILNNFGASFRTLNQTYRPNNANSAHDGFTSGARYSDLHAQHQPTIRRPTVTILKEVRNATTNTAFGPDSGVNGGDTYEYRITLTTTGSVVPAYDISLVDTLPVKLLLNPSGSDGLDNDGDGLADGADPDGEGLFVAGAGGNIVFNQSNTGGLTAGSSFAQLDTGNSITLLYSAKGDSNAIVGGDLLINTATATYTSLPGTISGMTDPYGAPGDSYGELSLDVYATATISVGRVSGWVYLDGNKNASHDGFEAGTTLTLYAKIINKVTGVVQEVQPVNPVTGTYAFGTMPAGDYDVIVDVNNVIADVTPNIPVGWTGTEAPTQRRTFTLGVNGSANNLNFGLFSGNITLFNGRVFKDDGVGGGNANNAVQDGTEVGIPSVSLALSDCYGTVYTTANTDGAGDFSLVLQNDGSIVNGATLCVDETNITGYLSTGGGPGTAGGSYDRATDRQTTTLNVSTTSTGMTFADVPPNTFYTDGQQSALPGTIVIYPHTFTAATGGSVTFASTFIPTPTIPDWADLLYLDTNCNQTLDAADTQLTGATVLASSAKLCLLEKQFVPFNAPFDSRNLITITASFDYLGATPVLPVINYVRHDLTLVGQGGLQLHKAVDKTTALPGDTITYTITYTNPTSAPLGNLVIHDTTPAYTTFVSAVCGALPNDLIPPCTITDPGIGVNGSLQWQMTGTLAPLSSGSVSYSVKITP